MGSLISLEQAAAGACDSIDGGIVRSYATQRENIVSATVDAGTKAISNFVMTTVGLWVLYVYDQNDTTSYNQSGVRTGAKFNANKQAIFSFPGITQAKINAANEMLELCDVVWIHELTSGAKLVQGIDIVDGEAIEEKNPPVATPSANSNAGDGQDEVTFTIDSVGRRISPVVDLTRQQIEDL